MQGLRSSVVGTHEFSEAIQTLTEELASDPTHSGGAEVRLNVEGTPRRKRPLIRDEIYRIASEALRNAFRHAEASRIEVHLSYGEKSFELRVRDDGKGIDPKFLTDEGPAGHFGLRGMRERAEQIGGKLSVWSAPGSGTELVLSVPGAIAYDTAKRARVPGCQEHRPRHPRRRGHEQRLRCNPDPHGRRSPAYPSGHCWPGRDSIRHASCRRGDQRTRSAQGVPRAPSRYHVDGSADPGDGWARCVSSLFVANIPEARIIVLTTYSGDVQAVRALKAGARGLTFSEGRPGLGCCSRRFGTCTPVGVSRCPSRFSFQLAEHATDDALTADAQSIWADSSSGVVLTRALDFCKLYRTVHV